MRDPGNEVGISREKERLCERRINYHPIEIVVDEAEGQINYRLINDYLKKKQTKKQKTIAS